MKAKPSHIALWGEVNADTTSWPLACVVVKNDMYDTRYVKSRQRATHENITGESIVASTSKERNVSDGSTTSHVKRRAPAASSGAGRSLNCTSGG